MGQIGEEKQGLLALPFLITQISKGCQRDKMEGTIRDRSIAITKTIWVEEKISMQYLSITPANGVWNSGYQGITLLGQR